MRGTEKTNMMCRAAIITFALLAMAWPAAGQQRAAGQTIWQDRTWTTSSGAAPLFEVHGNGRAECRSRCVGTRGCVAWSIGLEHRRGLMEPRCHGFGPGHQLSYKKGWTAGRLPPPPAVGRHSQPTPPEPPHYQQGKKPPAR